MDLRSVLRKKRDGGELTEEEMRFFVDACVRGEAQDYHAAALLASIFQHGMSRREVAGWTRAMIASGTTLAFPNLPQKKADKHSTGGVGDKVSIPLAPAVAACGVCVPMISGRGLGHTGGTLDKLESIPGFRTALGEAEIARALDRTGLAFGAQTESLVPADRIFYRLRDATELTFEITRRTSTSVGRSSGCFAIICSSSSPSSGARSGLIEVGRGGGIIRCAEISSATLSASNGTRPHSIS